MCGNGGRCIVHFAYNILKILPDSQNIKFLAVDGVHEAKMMKDGLVKLKMQDMGEMEIHNGLNFIKCGTTPDYVQFVENLERFSVVDEGRKIRDNPKNPRGDVNFVELKDEIFHARTYERGVEEETMACGTGATAIAIISHQLGKLKENVAHIKMPGGELKIEFEEKNGRYTNIWLEGPATFVCKGEIK